MMVFFSRIYRYFNSCKIKKNISIIPEVSNNLKKNNLNIYINNYKLYHTDFIETTNKIIVINMDFINSTSIQKKNGIKYMINLNQKFMNDLKEILYSKYDNHIYIHEVVGDGIMLISAVDWIPQNINDYNASIVFNFLQDVYEKTNSYIDIRIGISYGKIFYGNIDGNIRLFGDVLSLSNRLESNADKDNIMVDLGFYKKLLYENSTIDLPNTTSLSNLPNTTSSNDLPLAPNTNTSNLSNLSDISIIIILDLKGFGKTECVKIKLN